jgi:hypothetical protein
MELNGWERCRREIDILIFETWPIRTRLHIHIQPCMACPRPCQPKQHAGPIRIPSPRPVFALRCTATPCGDPHPEGRWTTYPGSG